jgi:hypothetical protein
MKPPKEIDDADVIWWAWSGIAPFFEMPVTESAETIAIYGLAVCRHPKSGNVYRFSCNAEWEVENDSQWPTIEEALQATSTQFDASVVQWRFWKPEEN